MKYIGNFFILTTLFLCACGSGSLDYSTRIGSSNFYVTYNDSSNRYIWLKSKSGDEIYVIERNVIQFKYNHDFIVAVRQATKSYECSEGSIATEVSDDFKYWMIKLKNEKVYGPLNFEAFNELAVSFKVPKGLNLKNEALYKKEYKVVPLKGCTNPDLILHHHQGHTELP